MLTMTISEKYVLCSIAHLAYSMVLRDLFTKGKKVDGLLFTGLRVLQSMLRFIVASWRKCDRGYTIYDLQLLAEKLVALINDICGCRALSDNIGQNVKKNQARVRKLKSHQKKLQKSCQRLQSKNWTN